MLERTKVKKERFKIYQKMLREFPTKAETRLRDYLRKKGMSKKGLVFQKRLGSYIYDFSLRRYKILIEVDGGYHNEDYQQIYDYKKQKFAAQCGWYVLHINNYDVWNNIDKVFNDIKHLIYNRSLSQKGFQKKSTPVLDAKTRRQAEDEALGSIPVNPFLGDSVS